MDIKPTIVSALFDIGRDKWSNFYMNYHTYISWSEHLLSMNTPIVFFTEDKFKKDIEDIRRKYDPEFIQTKIIIKELKELEMYKSYYKKVYRLMKSNKFSQIVQFPDVPEMCQPLYNIIMYSKLNFLKETYDKQYLPSNIMIWKDAAVYRAGEFTNEKWPNTNKIDINKPLFYSHHEKISILEPTDHLLSQMRFIQGGSMVIPGKLLDTILKEYVKLVDYYLELGYIGSDEKYFDLLVKLNPKNYKLVKVDWRDYKKHLQ